MKNVIYLAYLLIAICFIRCNNGNIHDDSAGYVGQPVICPTPEDIEVEADAGTYRIELKQQAAKDSWEHGENTAVNRESFRRNVHSDIDKKKNIEDTREGFYFKGKRITLADRFKDRKLYEKKQTSLLGREKHNRTVSASRKEQ